MSVLPSTKKSVFLNTQGEKTGVMYVGNFTIKCVLSHNDIFAIERAYSYMLPAHAEINTDNKTRAALLAELSVRVIDAPTWWGTTDMMRELVDIKPITDLMLLCKEAEDKWYKDLKTVADAAATPQE